MRHLRIVAVGAVGLALVVGSAAPARAQRIDSRSFRTAPRSRDDDETTRLLRNQAQMRATLEDLRTDVQVTQAKVEEMTAQFGQVLQELEELRMALAGADARARAGAQAAEDSFPTLARPRAGARPSAPPRGRGATGPPPDRRVVRAPDPTAARPLREEPARSRPEPPPLRRAPEEPVPAPARGVPLAPPPDVSGTPEASEEEQFAVYEGALNEYHGRNYADARRAFADYLQRFPRSGYANNAQFYIGQCFYAEAKYADAVEAYRDVVDRYPGGTKVPSALLKIGYAYEKLDQPADAKGLFQQVVERYPYSSEAQLARNRLQKL